MTSNTKQFFEMSSIFEVGNIKNEAILRDFLQTWKVECGADGLVPIRFAIFPVHLCKVPRLPRKSDDRSYEVLAPVTQNHLSKPEDQTLQNSTPLRKLAPWPLTSLMNMSLVMRLPGEMHLSRSSSNAPHLPSFLECYETLWFCSLLAGCRVPCAGHAKPHLNLQKWSVWCVFNIVTWKCASRHNDAHFFDISTSKSASNVKCF